MPSVSDLSRAANILLKVQEHLTQKGQIQHDDDLQSMITLFENPIFRQMVKLQTSLETLNNEAKKENFDPNAVDFSTESGALLIGGEEVKVDNDLKVEDRNVSDFVKDTAHGRQIEEIDLFKYPNESLGFSVVGLRSEHRGDLGIFVQDIKPGGMACRDGRLKESDQILAINDHALSPNVSHQQAIAMLQKSKGLVKLIVARGGFPQSFVGSSRGGSCSSSASDLSSLSQETSVPEMNWSHVETIELTNTGNGLGFGIVGGKATGGVVVKTIVDGGAASVDGRLKSRDHILRIGDTDLTQMNSEQVAVVLRQCGTTVRLVVARTDDDGDEDFESESFTQHSNIQQDEFRPSVTTTNDRSSSSSSEELAKELFEVELVKDTKGLGITIHGFLSEDEDNDGETGVFVKSITSGSASDIDGRIRIGDQIIAVDGKRLDGEDISSEEAVEILRSTGVVVRLTMARSQGNHDNINFSQQQFSSRESRTDEDDTDDRENTEHENDEDEDDDFSGIMSESEEENIRRKWNMVLGGDYEIVVAQLRKFNYTSGLGISLEGTVDYTDTPHHYLRSILPEGPVGRNGKLQAGDELLEVNGNRLLGMNHVEVVVILKELPLAVRMVCARQRHNSDGDGGRDITRDSVVFEEKDGAFLELKPPQQQPPLPQAVPTRVESVTSPGTSSTSSTSSSEDTISAIKLPEMVPMEHYGVEEQAAVQMVRPSVDISSESDHSPDLYNQPTTAHVGDAWHNDIIYIDLIKEESVGLGFSILELPEQEYERTAVVVRSLLEGGIAEKDGRLEPGDRLLMVNQYDLSQSDLDHAVAILKSVPGGLVKIGVVKPRAQYRTNVLEEDEDDDDIPDVVQNYLPEEPQMRRRSSSSSESSLEVQPITPSPLLPPPSVEEHSSTPILHAGSSSNSRVEVKQIQMSGMTAIALTTTSPTPMNDDHHHQFHHHHNHPPTEPLASSSQRPPAVPPKPQHYSAPSWQTATVNHPKPPMDGYERIVHMNKGSSSLGVSVRPDKDGDGLLVVSVMSGGAVDTVGEPQVGDMIRRVNNDSAVGLGAMQARSLILNHSKFSAQITMCYIPGQYIDAFKRGIPFNEKVSSPEKVMAHQSPNRRQHFAAIKSIFEDSASSDTNSHHSSSSISSPVLSTSMWGSYQRVEIMKHENEELGLDIVGGRDEEMPQLSNGETLQGIFVRSIEAEGPLARDGRIKTGDKILKIGTFDLTNATHAEAIEAFSQQHSSRTTFIVQSFISRNIKKTAAAAAPPSEENEDDAILRKYEHVEGDKRVVRLVKGPSGLGISMAGSKEKKVFVVGVKPDGEAGRSGKIKVGDQLLEINNHPLDGDNNNQVARQLISTCQSTLVMVICRQVKQQQSADDASTANDEDVKIVKLVKDFQGLGFSIMPCNEGICIKSIARDGTAERDGRLKPRDLLLAVDDQPLSDVSCETATLMLKQARGVVKLQVKTAASGGGVF